MNPNAAKSVKAVPWNPNLWKSAKAVAWVSDDVIALQRKLLKRSNDPRPVPDEPMQFWRLPKVVERLGVSDRTVYRYIETGDLPSPVVLDRMLPGTTKRAGALHGD